MNLLFAINGGYIPTFLNCMRSVLLHGGASHYEVFILHSDLTPADEERVRAALKNSGLMIKTPDRSCYLGISAVKSLKGRARIDGKALAELDKETLAYILNECLKVFHQKRGMTLQHLQEILLTSVSSERLN